MRDASAKELPTALLDIEQEYQRDDDPGEVGQDSHPSPHGSPFQSPR